MFSWCEWGIRKNTLLFTCSATIMVRLVTVNMNYCFTAEIRIEMPEPILVTLLKIVPPIQHHLPISLVPPPGPGSL